MKNFTHLHVHTPYSLLDGFGKIDRLIEKAKNLSMNSIAITDHGNMFGVVEFYKAAKKAGIKPILGCEVYTSARTMHDKENQDKKSGHLILLAKNNTGYRNLVKLVSKGFIEGKYYKPRIDYNLLEKHSEGLIGLSACLAGEIQQKLLYGEYSEAKALALKLSNIFEKDSFYLELQDHGIQEQKIVNQQLKKLSKDTNIPCVVTNDVHYTDKIDSFTHDLLLCVQTRKTLQDKDRMEFLTREFYLKSYEEMVEIFPNDLEALENTNKIADMCDVEFDFNTYHLPYFDIPKEYNTKEYLRKICNEGFERLNIPQEKKAQYSQRLDYELSVIDSMGFNEYFLVVWDYVQFAKKNNIMVGPGRGSAAGSIVAYFLGITTVDPIKHNLIFERFLNPERISMPDIDVDFCSERREEVLEYVKQRYGEDKVAQIITFGTFAAKQAIKDVGRVLGEPIVNVDKITKEIPFSPNITMTIEKALEMSPSFKNIYNTNEKARTIIEKAKEIEGLPRHASVHAAGVVISKEPIDDYIPLFEDEGKITTQFAMKDVEQLGFLKMDFLVLKTLTVIQKTLKNIKEAKNLELNLDQIPYDDKKVYEMLSSGNSIGVFQLESVRIRNFMTHLKPENFDDLVTGISLFRPGPMESIPTYIRNKKDPSQITYKTEKLEPVLKSTSGIMIYQEQVMQIVRDLAGYSYGHSDLVRRAMAKKQMDIMEKERKNFVFGNEELNITGCIKNGISEEIANTIFDEMIDFANYAFNKSHATAYAVISYQTAYLKANFPVEFMSALMTTYMGDIEKIAEYRQDCEQLGIRILPPDVNKSTLVFKAEDGNIRFPLTAIKTMGYAAAKNIVDARKESEYTSFEDLLDRLDVRNINKRIAESLIKSGALDKISKNRATLMSNYTSVVESAQDRKRKNISGQISLFDGIVGNTGSIYRPSVDNNGIEINEFRKSQLLSMEKEVLGFYISGNPLDEDKQLIDLITNETIKNLYDINSSDNINKGNDNGRKIIICGIISYVKLKETKNHDLMSFLVVDDGTYSVEVVVFPKVFNFISSKLVKDEIIIIHGRLSYDDDYRLSVIADEIQTLKDFKSSKNKKVYIQFENINKNIELVKKIEQIVKSNKGDSIVKLYDKTTRKVFVNQALTLNLTPEVIENLIKVMGKENIKIQS